MKKLSEIDEYGGFCCPETLLNGQVPDERLTCVICFQIMTKPVTLLCKAGHSYGLACIRQWLKGKTISTCPYCRETIEQWRLNEELRKEICKMSGRCQYCEKWEGNLEKLLVHQMSCMGYYHHLEEELALTVAEQIKILNKEIDPHLGQQHKDIYGKYVQEWHWLHSDLRDWKWWWWASNPWWEETPCKTCNNLWHKYDQEISLLEYKRIALINLINDNFAQSMIDSLFPQL